MEGDTNLPWVTGSEVRMDLWLETAREYTLDQLEIGAENTKAGITREICLSQHVEDKMGKVQRLDHNKFGQRWGDVWREFSCREVTVELREDTHCYQSEAPVKHPELPFLDLVTRTLQTTGSPRPCLHNFPLEVQGEHSWWKLLPEVTKSLPPRSKSIAVQPTHHHLDRLIGLYSKQELKEFRHVLEFPAYTELMGANLALGLCSGAEGCPLETSPGAPSYSLANLERDVMASITPHWMTVLRDMWYYYGISGGCLLPVLFAVWWFWGRPKTSGTGARTTTNINMGGNPTVPAPQATPTTVNRRESTPSTQLCIEMEPLVDQAVCKAPVVRPSAIQLSGGCETAAPRPLPFYNGV